MKKFADLILRTAGNILFIPSLRKLRQLPENTVILVGTWRVDMNEGYFMRNATYAMMEVTPYHSALPPSSVSLGH